MTPMDWVESICSLVLTSSMVCFLMELGESGKSFSLLLEAAGLMLHAWSNMRRSWQVAVIEPDNNPIFGYLSALFKLCFI